MFLNDVVATTITFVCTCDKLCDSFIIVNTVVFSCVTNHSVVALARSSDSTRIAFQIAMRISRYVYII